MEIERIRKELNHLLDNVVDHSSRYSDERPIPSLEVSFVLSKINKMQENLTVLKFLLEKHEKEIKRNLKEERKRLAQEKKIETEEENQPLSEPNIEFEPIVTLKNPTEQKEEINPVLSESRSAEASLNTEQPTTKLIDSLTLNDRYLYANELFNKDMNAFNEFVKSIDNSLSLAAAKEILFALDLDVDNEYIASFSELIDRRFS